MINEGAFKARACEAVLAFTQSRDEHGNPKRQVAVDFVLVEGPDAGEHITWYGYFTDATWERTIDSLRIMGWGGADLDDLSGVDANEVRLVIAHEDDQNGELRARVKWVNALGGVAVKDRMDAGAARAFAQEMKGRILAHGARQGSATRKQQRPTGAQRTEPDPGSTGQGDDHIPF